MNARRSRSESPRPASATPATLSLRSSTAGWYAEWKARKQAAPAPAAAPEAARPDAAAEALARWLTADSGK